MVHWYTGHPSSVTSSSHTSSSESPQSLIPYPLPEHVTVVGVGNVALDVARILLSDPSRLEPYGLPDHVMQSLRESKVKHVSIVGRRGPREASFTAKELREMMNLEGVAFTGLDPRIMQDALSEEGGKKLERQKKRILDILKKGSTLKVGDEGVERTWSLEFWRSPTGVASADGSPASALTEGDHDSMRLTLAHTALSSDGRVKPTGETSVLTTSLIVTALGHVCAPETTPYCDAVLGHIRTVGGSFTHPESQGTNREAADVTAVEKSHSNEPTSNETSTTSPLASADAAAEGAAVVQSSKPLSYGQVLDPVTHRPVPNVYAAGWAARGAKGVLGTTMLDAHAVGESIAEDWLSALIASGYNLNGPISMPASGERWKGPTLAVLHDGATDGSEVSVDGEESVPDEVYHNVTPGEHRRESGVVTYAEWLQIEANETKNNGRQSTWEDVGGFLVHSSG